MPLPLQISVKEQPDDVNRPRTILGLTPLMVGPLSVVAGIQKIGKQSVSIQIGGKYYADTQRYGPTWGAPF
jgi:hypothetical protein